MRRPPIEVAVREKNPRKTPSCRNQWLRADAALRDFSIGCERSRTRIRTLAGGVRRLTETQSPNDPGNDSGAAQHDGMAASATPPRLEVVAGDAALPNTGLSQALLNLARGDRSDLAALLHDVEVHASIDGTKVTCHCHSIRVDRAGRPRVDELTNALCESALDFAIPRSEIERARERDAATGSTRQIARLLNQARGLFTDLVNSGEGGELLLFVLGETFLRLPQVMCKMSLKTNPRMHVHGVDGVHAGVDPAAGQLALYWGESKIYQDATTAIRDCLASLAPFLTGAGPTSAATRDLQLLQRATDLNDAALEQALKRFLDPRDPAHLDLEFRGLCLVGFDSDAYPATGAQQDAVVAAVLAQLPGWKDSIQRRIHAEQLDNFAIHVFCVPFPDVDAFRASMRRFLGLASAAA